MIKFQAILQQVSRSTHEQLYKMCIGNGYNFMESNWPCFSFEIDSFFKSSLLYGRVSSNRKLQKLSTCVKLAEKHGQQKGEVF